MQTRYARARDICGVAPQCSLVSLKVLGGSGQGASSGVMRALQYIREELNDDPKLLRVHGVNLSLGYRFDAEMFACGQSPLCVEVDRLVKSGVVVVAAAGNTGYGPINTLARPTQVALSNTINDPGNASLAITVGSSHRDSPHTYGVSFFSSKGPDHRRPPEAGSGCPGERITPPLPSRMMKRLGCLARCRRPDPRQTYIDDSGTSMSAPACFRGDGFVPVPFGANSSRRPRGGEEDLPGSGDAAGSRALLRRARAGGPDAGDPVGLTSKHPGTPVSQSRIDARIRPWNFHGRRPQALQQPAG